MGKVGPRGKEEPLPAEEAEVTRNRNWKNCVRFQRSETKERCFLRKVLCVWGKDRLVRFWSLECQAKEAEMYAFAGNREQDPDSVRAVFSEEPPGRGV